MGNEASLEGGEGLEGAAAAGDGGGPAAPSQRLVPAGVEADLSQLSEEERRQIVAVMSRAQGLPRGNLAGAEPPPMQRHSDLDTTHHPRQPGKPPDPGPGLSKSRTVDVLKTEQRAPGRSPSSISLRESKSRTDFKEDQKPSMMPSFLSEANPLSAVTSVVNKFNPFDLISDSDAAHEEAGRKQKVTQKEQGKPEEQRGLAKHPSQQQSPKLVQQQGPVKPTPQQTESSKPVPQQQQPGEPKQVQKPGPSHPGDSKVEQAKQPPQPRGPQKSQLQQSEPTKTGQQQTSAKTSVGPTKPLPQQPDSAKTSSQAPPPTKPSSQQSGPVKQPSQQPARQGGPVKPSAQQAGPPKQQPGSEKPTAQQTGPTKQPPQPGPGKPPLQQTGPIKQVPPQAGPAKPSSQTAGATKSLAQQPGLTKPTGQQPGPEKPLQQKQASTAQPVESTPKKTFCPLCTTTELLLHTPEKANYNTCTQCHTVVCSLCGFNPNPHITEVSNFKPMFITRAQN
uniref:Zinc finger piccolo-type domain-containing protein n=1 Tax=Pavo cristatus TaxID=9049 RepID=A0A8C9FQU8_PAVCR